MLSQRIRKSLRTMLKLTGMHAPLVSRARQRLEEFPQLVQVETTSVCNADCVMCPYSSMTRPHGPMEFSLYRKIVEECAAHQDTVKTFYPFLMGELFLTPSWPDYLAYARENLPRTHIAIFTNGSLLTERNVDRLLEIQPDWVNISFDGPDQETFEAIRRNLSFHKVTAGIQRLVRKRQEHRLRKPRVTVSIIEMAETRGKTPAFVKGWQKVVDEVNVDQYSNWGGSKPGTTLGVHVPLHRAPCLRLWRHLVILNNGDAALCCLDHDGQVVLGNVRQRSLTEIWRGAEITKIRAFHQTGHFDGVSLCADCSYGKYQGLPLWWG